MARRIPVGSSTQFTVGELTKVDVEGTSVVVTRTADGLCAVRNQCAHWPVPLAGGKIDKAGNIVCPLHNSRFDMCTGENRDWVGGFMGVKIPNWTSRLIAMGADPKGIQSYQIEEDGDQVFVLLEDDTTQPAE
jgi:nitrite reductase/ring-hydroxylating ferredoxin subunit